MSKILPKILEVNVSKDLTFDSYGLQNITFTCLTGLLLLCLTFFSSPVIAVSKLYPQLNSETTQNIAGNWQVTLSSKEGEQLHQYFIRMEAPYTAYCDEISESVCRYDVRDTGDEWVSAYVWAGNTFHRSFDITSPSTMTYNHAYGVIDHWGASSNINFAGHTGQGKWQYGDKDGTEVWKRLIPSIEKVVFYPVVRNPYREYSPTGVSEKGSIGEVTGEYSEPTWGPKNDAPGNRPFFYFNVYGQNLWGFHVLDMKGAVGFGVPVCNQNLYQNDSGKLADHIGLRCYAHVWPGATNGTKIIRFDNIEIPFDFNITGLALPLTAIVNIPQDWRYRDTMGDEDDYPKVDLNGADYAWKLKANKTKDWPTIKLNITGDGVDELDANKVSFSNPKLQLRSSRVAEDSIELTVTLLPQAQHGDTSLTIDGKTLPFSFEYGGGFPDLAISNETLDPNANPIHGAQVNLNSTVPLDQRIDTTKELLASIMNQGDVGVDGFTIKLIADNSGVWTYPKEIEVCLEHLEACKKCQQQKEDSGSQYSCKDMSLLPGQSALAKITMNEKPVNTQTAQQQCNAEDEIELQVAGRKENTVVSVLETVYSNNKMKVILERDNLDVANVEFEGVTVIPDEAGDIMYKYHNAMVSLMDRELFTIGETYPITRVHTGGLFQLKVNLHKAACISTKAQATLKVTGINDHDSYYKEYPLTVSEDGMSLVHELPFLAQDVGTEYQLSFKSHQATMMVEPLGGGVFSISAEQENGHNYRIAKSGEAFYVRMAMLGQTIPPNVWATQLDIEVKSKENLDGQYVGRQYKETLLLEKINQTTFSTRKRLTDYFVGEVTAFGTSSVQTAQPGLDVLQVVSSETDLHELDGLIYSEKGSAIPIEFATTDKHLVVSAMFNKSAPSNSDITLTLIRNGNELATWTVPAYSRNNEKLLVSDEIDLAALAGQYNMTNKDVIHASWQDNKDKIAVVVIEGQKGKLESLTIKQDNKVVKKLNLDTPFVVELDFEEVLDVTPFVYYQIESESDVQQKKNHQKSAKLKLIDKKKAIYIAELLVNQYGRSGNKDEALSGDKLHVHFHDESKMATFESDYEDEHHSLIMAYFDSEGDLADIEGTLQAKDPKKSVRFVSNRVIEVPYGTYSFDVKIKGCCQYKAALQVDDATPDIVQIPQLGQVSLINNPKNAVISLNTGGGDQKVEGDWQLLQETEFSGGDQVLLPAGNYFFTFKLPAPSHAVKGSERTPIKAGKNTLSVPKVTEMKINLFDASGQPRQGKVMSVDGQWQTGQTALLFDDDGAIKYFLSSENVLSPKLLFTQQAGVSNIYMGEKVFKPSRTKIDSKVVCTKQNRDNDFAHMDSAKGNTCMAIDYGKVYQFFPGEYQLEEVSTLPRSYHSQYELNLIDQGKKKLRQRVTKEMFTIEPKQQAKALGKAPSSLSR